MNKSRNPIIRELELSYTSVEYWHSRTLQINSPEWRELREVIIKRDNQTCRFCKIRLTKYMVVDHVNGDASDNSLQNLGLNCPACDSIRHCGLADIQEKLIIGNSLLSQVEIVKRTQNFYLDEGRVPSPVEIDKSFRSTNRRAFQVAFSRFQHPDSSESIEMANIRGYFSNQMSFYYLKFRIWEFDKDSNNENQENIADKQEGHLFDDLDQQQRNVVFCKSKRICVIAGPGCGKTKTLVSRIIYLLKSYQAIPAEIILLTFSRKSVKEIKERIKSVLSPPVVFQLTISNLHSFCYHFLRKNIECLDLEDNLLSIYDSKQQETLVKEILEEELNLASSSDQKEIRTIVSQISFCKICSSEDPSVIDFSEMSETRRKVALKYQSYLKKNKIFDFNDLLLNTLLILRGNKRVREEYQNKFSHLMIDEFQDVNNIQWEIIELLTGPNKTLVLVGDPNQSIYGFQGSSPELISSLEKKQQWTKIYLRTNYRSSRQIVQVGNEFLANNSGMLNNQLTANSTDKGIVKLVRKLSIVDTLEEIVSLSVRESLRMSEIAVLYRSNYLSSFLEQALIKKKVPYKILGSFRFIEREEIKDVIAYIRAIVHQDNLSTLRVLKMVKYIGMQTIKFIEQLSREQNKKIVIILNESFRDEKNIDFTKSMQKKQVVSIEWFVNSLNILDRESHGKENLVTFVKKIREYFQYEEYLLNKVEHKERMENIEQLMNIIEKWESENSQFSTVKVAAAEFLNYLSIAFEDQQLGRVHDSLILSTIHQVKGLEFEAVFFVNLDEGILPNIRSIVNMNEEKRIFYVGITRAKSFLYLVSNSNIASKFLSTVNGEI